MPLVPIRLNPGIDSVKSPTLNETSWVSGSNIRFFQGLMQKDSGWKMMFTLDPSLGQVKALKAWTSLAHVNFLGVGAQNGLVVWDGNALVQRVVTPAAWPAGPQQIVTLDNWGEFLMACPRGSQIFVWQPGPGGNAAPIPGGQAPPQVGFIFVSSQTQQLIACGMTNPATGVYDPMLVGWTDVGNYQVWTPTVGNQAGNFRLAFGSMLRSALALFGQNLLWTDTAIYSMSYIQPPLVYGFQPLGVNCGSDGPHAAGSLAGQVFWKGPNQFFTLGPSGPQAIRCPVWDQVFPNQDPANTINTTCQTDTFYGEISWMVLQRNGSYVRARLALDTGAWTADTYHPHTAWIDQNVFGAPIGGHDSGLVDQHDVGYDADTAPAAWTATTGIAMISEGDPVTFVQDLLPDFANDGTNPSVSIIVNAYDYPDTPPRVHGPFVVTPQSPVIHPRCRGRGIQFTFSGSDLGTFARLGNIRYRGSQDGRR